MPSGGRAKKRSDALSRFVTFIILALFWLMFSGKYDAFHLTLGLFCTAFVAIFSHDLLFENIRQEKRGTIVFRFILYIPWLIYQIILANLHVAYLVLNPRPIDPKVLNFKTKLKSDFAKVTFANSITLTPGTITMDISGDEFYVHALSKKVADDLESGEMENKVARVFLETPKGH